MSKTRVIDQADVICGLKAAVTALECQHNMQMLKTQKEKAERDATPSTVQIIIPVQVDRRVAKKRSKTKSVRDTCISSKGAQKSLDKIRCKIKKSVSRCKVKDKSRLMFPEMRGGVLYSRCCCLHRDGLQDDCPLTQCQGQPQCLTKPWATCPPAKFVRSRYPELYPTPRTHCRK